MAWTVGQLKEELDGFGDHLEVELVIEQGEYSYRFAAYDVDSASSFEPRVQLTADWSDRVKVE